MGVLSFLGAKNSLIPLGATAPVTQGFDTLFSNLENFTLVSLLAELNNSSFQYRTPAGFEMFEVGKKGLVCKTMKLRWGNTVPLFTRGRLRYTASRCELQLHLPSNTKLVPMSVLFLVSWKLWAKEWIFYSSGKIAARCIKHQLLPKQFLK